jgi:hypothetical protein
MTMKKIILMLTCVILLTNCKRNIYYCHCTDINGPVYVYKYGKCFATKESSLRKECNTHISSAPNAECHLVIE